MQSAARGEDALAIVARASIYAEFVLDDLEGFNGEGLIPPAGSLPAVRRECPQGRPRYD
jgi:hypothetical protein